MKDYPRMKNQEKSSLGGWIMTILLTNIPVLGIIFSLCFLGSKSKSKRSYAAALLIMLLVFIILLVCLFLVATLAKGSFPEKIYDNFFGPLFTTIFGWFNKFPPRLFERKVF